MLATFNASPFTDIWVVRIPATVEKTGGCAPFPTFSKNALPFSAPMAQLPFLVEAIALELDMISALLALMLAAPSPDALASARKDYNRCLTAYMKASMEKKADEAAYTAGMTAACGPKEAAFRTASIAVDGAAGIRRAAAEENANLEIQDMRTNSVHLFKDWAKGNAPQ